MAVPGFALRASNVAAYTVFILVNVAASRGWLGPTNEKLSKKNATPITPAGWAFAIWGLIFALQGVGVLYQALDYGYQDERKGLAVEAIGYWWIAGWVAESGWQILFQMQTTVGMWLCAACLLSGCFSFARASINLYRLSSAHPPALVYSAYYLPTSINTAWLSVASCIGVLIVGNTLHFPYPQAGAVALAATVTAAGMYVMFTTSDAAYGCVLVWALLAVASKQGRWPVGVAALACAAVSLVGVAFSVRQLSQYQKHHDYVEL